MKRYAQILANPTVGCWLVGAFRAFRGFCVFCAFRGFHRALKYGTQRGKRNHGIHGENGTYGSHGLDRTCGMYGLIASLLLLFVLFTPLIAQPERADALFAEAKQLATTGTFENRDKALGKFEESANLYRSAGNQSKADEVDLEHGRLLRVMGNSDLESKRFEYALDYFQRALAKFRKIRNSQETAFVYHDLGYLASETKDREKAIGFYEAAIAAYLSAGDKNGEAAILRNIGLIRLADKNYAEAIALFESAMKIRLAEGNLSQQAVLKLDFGDVSQAQQKYPETRALFTEALRLYRLAKDRSGEAGALYKLGRLPSSVMKYADAIANFEAALKINEELNEYANEANSLWQIGRLHVLNGKNRDAERPLVRAMETYMIIDIPENEAWVAIDLAANYEALNRYQEARSIVERSLELFRKVKEQTGEAYALLIYAETHSFLNEHDQAFAKIEAAKKLFQAASFKQADYRIARAYASHFYSLSNHGESIRYATIALREAEKTGDPMLKASAYIDIANSYAALGQRQKAIDYTTKALELSRKAGSAYTESICLSNIGYSHLRLENLAEAESYFLRAIPLMQANGFELEEAYATHNLGLLHYKRKDYAKALAAYDRAFPLYRKAGDRRPEAFLYDSYGELYRDLGRYDKAIENLQKAVVLAREIRYSDVEAAALGNMMTLWTRRSLPRLAILYGKQAVNVYQGIRASNLNADKASQKSFVASNEKTYRQLANLLIDDGRLGEAQQVLDLLKSEEYFDFVRRDATQADEHAALALTESERKALEEYSRVSSELTSLGSKFQTLQDKKNRNGGKLPENEEATYQQLKAQVETAGQGLKTFFAKLATEFSKKVEDGTTITPQSIETMKADLRRAGSDVVLVSTYLLPERYRAIVTTGRAMVDRKVEYSSLKLTGADINRKIFEFQRALQSPNTDPRKLGKELYDIFVKPLEGDLRGAEAKTILWSLDGSLRYIPIAALSPDGKTYLAEKYQNVVVTLGRQSNLFASPAAGEWRAIGAGVSKQHAGFSALPSVPIEIGSIVYDEGSATGVLGGVKMLDEQFNLESLRNTVPQQTDDGKPFNVLHLATHFSLGANDQDSALLLGDGTRLSLFEIGRDEALDFKDVELLTLSACQTAVSTGDANGSEVESLGMLAQKKGAKAVLATLWKVADESTSLFMTEFYRIKKANATMNKAEAIRLAQLAMIEGRIKASGTSDSCRAEKFGAGAPKDEFKCDPNAPFSHPYFWSPFVLIGNWR